jgi:aarF domain-containing kinase
MQPIGLYRELSPLFRLQYAMLWRSIIFGDIEGIKHYSSEMNCGDLYPLFAAMLTHKPLVTHIFALSINKSP